MSGSHRHPLLGLLCFWQEKSKGELGCLAALWACLHCSKVTVYPWKHLMLPHVSLGTNHSSCCLQTLLLLTSPSVTPCPPGFSSWSPQVTSTMESALTGARCAPAPDPVLQTWWLCLFLTREFFPGNLPVTCTASIRDLRLETVWNHTNMYPGICDGLALLWPPGKFNLRDLKPSKASACQHFPLRWKIPEQDSAKHPSPAASRSQARRPTNLPKRRGHIRDFICWKAQRKSPLVTAHTKIWL